MLEIGKYHTLKIVKRSELGVYLDAGSEGELLLPADQAPGHCSVGEAVDVFLYCNADKKIVPTTDRPYAAVGEFAFLKVVDVLDIGAFLDWGLPKDLFVPAGEQKVPMQQGEFYVVYVYKDERRNQLAASSRLDAFLDKTPAVFQENDPVDLLICHQTELGYNAVINGTHWGLIHRENVFQDLKQGQRMKGFIKKMRDDGKIDLSLQRQGYYPMDDLEQKILEQINQADGALAVTDKSPPDVIYEVFGVSKKKYKMALGSLYKARRIRIEDDIIGMAE